MRSLYCMNLIRNFINKIDIILLMNMQFLKP